jgi:hypothetical protein
MKARAILFIAAREWLERRAALAQVLERVRPETRALLDDPPVRTAWLSCDVFEDVYQAIAGLLGVESVRELGHEATRDSLASSILRPILEAVASVSSSPAQMFAKLNLSIQASMKGVTTKYRETGERSGVVTAFYAAPLPPMVMQASLGALRYTFDLCEVQGTVTLLHVEEGGCQSQFGVDWR